jgi:thioredoxin 1
MFDITSFDELNNFISNSSVSNKKIMLIFSASWCGPCKNLKETILKTNLEREKNVAIAYIDIDRNDEIAERFHVKSLPTQVFVELQDGRTVAEKHRIQGFNWTALTSYLVY